MLQERGQGHDGVKREGIGKVRGQRKDTGDRGKRRDTRGMLGAARDKGRGEGGLARVEAVSVYRET